MAVGQIDSQPINPKGVALGYDDVGRWPTISLEKCVQQIDSSQANLSVVESRHERLGYVGLRLEDPVTELQSRD